MAFALRPPITLHRPIEEARAQIVHPSLQTTLWRCGKRKRPVQIADVTKEQGYFQGEPFVVIGCNKGGYRSVLSVPMLHEDQVVGVITIFRQEDGSFGDEHISCYRISPRKR